MIAATEGSLQIYYVEASDAAKHLSMPRTASTTRNCSSPNVQSGRVESESVSHSVMFVIPMDYSPSGSSVHGVLQARILEWVAIHFSRGSSQPRDLLNPGIEPGSSALQADSLLSEPQGKPLVH